MRTMQDLDGAFALLTRAADAHAEQRNDGHTTPTGHTGPTDHSGPTDHTGPTDRTERAADVLALTSTPRAGRHRSLRRTGIALVAAAAVAALVAGGASWLQSDGTPTHPAGDGGSGGHLDTAQLTLPLSVDPTSHLAVVEVDASQGLQTVQLANRHENLQVSLWSAHDGTHPAPHQQPVVINGRRGFYNAGTGEALIHPGAVADTTDKHPSFSHAVVWEYTDGGWALLLSQGRELSRAALLAGARALRFDGSHPVRSPLSLSAAPAGMRLGSYFSIRGTISPVAPFTVDRRRWEFEAIYFPTRGNGVAIAVYPLTPQDETYNRSGTVMDVGGHRGYLKHTPSGLRLFVDLGHHVWLDVSEEAEPYDAPQTFTGQDLARVATSARIVGHPADYGTWGDIRTVLP